jgi:hypothetical protein
LFNARRTLRRELVARYPEYGGRFREAPTPPMPPMEEQR